MSELGGYGQQPPGWYPDPGSPALMRWWDGSAWTNHRASIGFGPDHPPPQTTGRGKTIAKVILLCLLAGAALLALLFGLCLALLAGAY